jgi:alpha-beta hydrolase superfamily lysophospholipase
MSSTTTHVEQLRATARHLHSLAGLIGGSRALDVYSLAGTDTWEGPTPLACRAALVALRRQLLANQQTLTDTARRLERRADLLEQQPLISSAS